MRQQQLKNETTAVEHLIATLVNTMYPFITEGWAI